MQLMERVVGREAVAARWDDLQSTARRSIQGFVLPPYSATPVRHSESVQDSLLRRGGRSCAIYGVDALQSPDVVAHIRQMRTISEQSRVAPWLPMKLAIVDRRTALVCSRATAAQEHVDTAYLVRESPALDGLIALFDTYWRRSAEATTVAAVASVSSADEQAVLKLLAQGLKDEAIARQLGVSTHTVRRRITSLMRQLGVSTRFQAGLVLGAQALGTQPATSVEEAADQSTCAQPGPE